MTGHDRALALIVIATLVTTPAASEVLHGTATTQLFSHQCGLDRGGTAVDVHSRTTVDYWSIDADLALSETVNMCGLFTLWFSNGGLGTWVGGTLEDLETAPEPTTPWVNFLPPINEACVLKTVDGLYVKFAVRALRDESQPIEADIEYYIQTDGTPVFGPSLPVTPKTWGAIKALYR